MENAVRFGTLNIIQALKQRIMIHELTEKLLELYEQGYTIKISMGLVDDGFHLYIADEDTLEQNGGFHTDLELNDICFDSESYAQYPLKNIPPSKVRVFKEIHNWVETDIKELILI